MPQEIEDESDEHLPSYTGIFDDEAQQFRPLNTGWQGGAWTSVSMSPTAKKPEEGPAVKAQPETTIELGGKEWDELTA